MPLSLSARGAHRAWLVFFRLEGEVGNLDFLIAYVLEPCGRISVKKGAQPIYMSPFRMGPCASYRRIQPIGPISHGLHPHAHPPIGPRMEGRFPAMVLRTRTMLDAKWNRHSAYELSTGIFADVPIMRSWQPTDSSICLRNALELLPLPI